MKKSDRVLEVGTGSGYLAALLAHRSQQVYSIEINPKLASMGAANLARAGSDNVTVEEGDGALGWSRHAPYDVIVLTGSTPVLPESLPRQLKVGGRLFAIVGDAPAMAARLISCTAEGAYLSRDLFETSLPPLKNALQPARFHF